MNYMYIEIHYELLNIRNWMGGELNWGQKCLHLHLKLRNRYTTLRSIYDFFLQAGIKNKNKERREGVSI